MASEPDNLTLLQLKHVRFELSNLRSSIRELSARVIEMETREVADASARLRHEERFAEVESELHQIRTRLGLNDG